jgi:Asp-tRNA(Asn)/Glu-tRNA(Gln) amidotransferase C subunit
MRGLTEAEVKALSDVAGVNIPQEDLTALTTRLNGLMDIFQILESLPLDKMEPIPTLLTQRDS